MSHPSAYAFIWCERLAKTADALQKLEIQSIALGFQIGYVVAKGWDHHDMQCQVVALVSWVFLLLPIALRNTAICWAEKITKAKSTQIRS